MQETSRVTVSNIQTGDKFYSVAFFTSSKLRVGVAVVVAFFICLDINFILSVVFGLHVDRLRICVPFHILHRMHRPRQSKPNQVKG